MRRVLLSLTALSALVTYTHETLAADPPPPTTYYLHNWTDHNGGRHMTHCPFHI